jgi:predicted nucleotidyltransferase
MTAATLDDPILKRFRAALDGIYGDRIERVVLYGSRARGDHREDSDYDVAVFLYEPWDWHNDRRRVAEIEADILYETGALISAQLFAAKAHEKRTGFMLEVRLDGIDL